MNVDNNNNNALGPRTVYETKEKRLYCTLVSRS
jgi:hypothetical protein